MNEKHYYPNSFPGLEKLLAGGMPAWVTDPDLLRRVLPVIIRDDRLLSYCLSAHETVHMVEDSYWFSRSVGCAAISLLSPILQEEYGFAEDDLAGLSVMEEIVRTVIHCLNQYPTEKGKQNDQQDTREGTRMGSD